ncbi:MULTISPECIES: iron-containing alcohol dehydrogenase [Flectobacillus]|uniref:iron-containing alcohol dehydrogenase n=1 Tax=Flectobacillus TaxID=101 RepID=UPI000BA4558B|nr:MULTISPECIES: iron-containing alcohol dehydrogenase [Flectobacillus]MDI9872084.1 iron-containing alcohol dehydrogenase [Flectobacillus roseus]NBA74721.1 iron-containing alcohol dehydrogenase [Emticicia sp. ODNR4P]PAC28180.1 NADH-dependent alcohol dehydrogenase [Flectobacillus sp. BAB-3569]
MLNFELQNPTKILFGKGQIANIAKEIPANARVLMTYGGGSIKTNGVYEQVIEALKGHEVVEFSGIEPNPTYETLMKAVEIIRTQKLDYVLAVGGGSVIDGTKFIVAAVDFEGEPWDILAKSIRTTQAMPFGTVLTLPATGSEMNSGAVVTRVATQEKLSMGGPGLFPKFSVLDPEVIKSIPVRQLRNGIVDAYTHVLEQYMTYPANAWLQDRFAESILQTLIEVAPKILADPSNYEAAANFMWSCTMALNGLIQKGVPTDWATHMIGHELTALYNIDHAMTLAIIFPNLYRNRFDNKKEKLAQYGERVWNITEGSIEEKANAAIERTVAWLHELGVKTRLSEYTSDYAHTGEFIEKRFTERGWKGLGERRDITPEVVKEIVEMSY